MLNPIRPQKLFDNEYRRYAKQIIINEVSTQGQGRLKQAKVLCIGGGGLGSPVLLYLTACGIGHIGIIDRDTVEISNLQRQILYNTDDLEKSKSLTAFYTLKKLNPNISIKSYDIYLNATNMSLILFDYDIIVDGTDNIKTRDIISQYCYQLHKIHIYGAIDKFTGQIGVFNYQNGHHYYDLPTSNPTKFSYNCNERGLINTLAGIIGTLQATEVIKIIWGVGSIASEYLIIYNLLNNSYLRTKIKKRMIGEIPHIKYHQKIEKNYISLSNLLKHNYYLIIDVRTNFEFKIKNIPISINIPLNILKQEQYLKNLKKISFYTIILSCNDENRSYLASQVLKIKNIRHYILKDGINSIRKERDSNPR